MILKHRTDFSLELIFRYLSLSLSLSVFWLSVSWLSMKVRMANYRSKMFRPNNGETGSINSVCVRNCTLTTENDFFFLVHFARKFWIANGDIYSLFLMNTERERSSTVVYSGRAYSVRSGVYSGGGGLLYLCNPRYLKAVSVWPVRVPVVCSLVSTHYWVHRPATIWSCSGGPGAGREWRKISRFVQN